MSVEQWLTDGAFGTIWDLSVQPVFTSLRLRYYPAVHETAVACRACLFGLFPAPPVVRGWPKKMENIEDNPKIYATLKLTLPMCSAVFDYGELHIHNLPPHPGKTPPPQQKKTKNCTLCTGVGGQEIL
jgi:hypothetical protein